MSEGKVFLLNVNGGIFSEAGMSTLYRIYCGGKHD